MTIEVHYSGKELAKLLGVHPETIGVPQRRAGCVPFVSGRSAGTRRALCKSGSLDQMRGTPRECS